MSKKNFEEDTLGNRMKGLENQSRPILQERLPIIIRLDGNNFHSYTKGLPRPFCSTLVSLMNETALTLCKTIPSVKLAYVQSDEISLLLYPWNQENSRAWFGNSLTKLVSISAGVASSFFSMNSFRLWEDGKQRMAVFDSRAFVLPTTGEVINCFLWRQKDNIRNSIQMLAQSHFSNKQLRGKNNEAMHEMLKEKGISWHVLPSAIKFGRVILKEEFYYSLRTPEEIKRTNWVIPSETPLFSYSNPAWILKQMGLSEDHPLDQWSSI